MQLKKTLSAVMLGVVIGLTVDPATAGVTYQGIDLGMSGTSPVSARWEYSYHVDGPFDQGAGFRLLYRPTEYANLDIYGNPLGSDWQQILTPDLTGVSDSTLDNFALVGIPASGADFAVAFDWLGAGNPGSQPYELYDATGTNTPGSPFATVSASVPEPASLLLVLAGLVALMLRNARLPTPSFLARS